ncbi:MAG: hypothetical protein KAS97_06555, partial [Candidatus Aminicenantes bacterium]|nr:hypothetical protein [Candidatus Aminicenantes bacterium]
MKKNILIIFIISAFILTAFGKPPARRVEHNSPERFIAKQLSLLGLKVGKVSLVGENGFIAIIKGFTSKTNALKLTKPFKSFSLKGTLKRITRNSKAIIADNKPTKGIIADNKNATGPVIINRRNTKLVINGKALLGAN